MLRLVVVALLLGLAACGAPETPGAKPLAPASKAKPDIVFFLLDAVRADHVPAYGYPREKMPFLAGLAERGVVYERAYAPSSWTPSSMASIFTGLWVNQHGVYTGFHATRQALRQGARMKLNRIPAAVPTLPEILERAGYRTFGASGNPNIDAATGFERGFRRFSGKDDGGVTGRVAEWKPELRSGGAPFFLYLHYMDAHDIGQLKKRPGQTRDEARREAYDAGLRAVVEKMRFALKTLGLLDGETLVVITADHGEEFLDHGGEGHWNKLYEELVRVPLILYWPSRLSPARVAQPVSSIDLLPTLREAAGLAPGADDQGVSLLATLRGEVKAERSFFPMRWWDATDPRSVRKAVIHGGAKYIVGLPQGDEELYDLMADPRERTNLIQSRPELAADLRRRLHAFEAGARVHPREFSDPVEISKEKAEELRALGYVQ